MKSPAIAACFVLVLAGCASTGGTKNLSSQEKARLMVEVANGALVEGDPTGALQTLFEARNLDDSLPELHHSLAIAYAAKHDNGDAVKEARRAVEIKPDYSDAQNTLGKLLLDQSKYDEAIPHLSAAANDPLYREDYKPWTSLGILYYRRGEYGTARESFDRAIRDAPQIACIAYYYRGHVMLHASRFKEAIRDYEFATRGVCATLKDAQLAVGIAYQQDRQYDKARRKYLEIVKQYPDTQIADQATRRLRELPN